MKSTLMLMSLAAALLALAGCRGDSASSTFLVEKKAGSKKGDSAQEIEAAMAKLSPEDRALAQAQRFCPSSNKPLGSMGAPVKYTLKGEAVFVCCEGCEDEVKKDLDATLSKVAELKEIQAALAKLSAEDRTLAETQRLCPSGDAPLGSMGVPVKIMIKGQPVFICCKGCKDDVEKDPEATLKKVAAAKAKGAGGH